MTQSLPQPALDIIDRYLHLSLGGKEVPCPYWRNRQGVRMGLAVNLGKGSPEEITEEVNIQSQQHKRDLQQMSVAEIREFMIAQGIGIDCSGFIVHVLAAVRGFTVRSLARRNIIKSPWRAFIAYMRPVENISVNVLTSIQKAKVIDFKEVQPGDIIKARGGRHALLVSAIEKDADGSLQAIDYYHSTSYYEPNHGVRQGQIKVSDLSVGLDQQSWLEVDQPTGRNYTLEGYSEKLAENGVFRLNILNTKY